MRLARLLMLLLSLTVASADPVRADARVALVIGNSAYANADKLRHSKRDAIALGAALERIGFEADVRTDLDRLGMLHALRDFGHKAEAADVALMFYAGHGVQVAGESYLLPIDVTLEREHDLPYEALLLDLVIGDVAKARALNVVILDVSRATRLTERLQDGLGPSRAPLVGTVFAPSPDLPNNTVVALATAPGALWFDMEADHSPYTTALLESLEVPGLSVEDLFRSVRVNVETTTAGRQVPWVSFGRGDSRAYGTPLNPGVGATDDPELIRWRTIQRSVDPADFEAYLEAHPNSAVAPLASERLGQLQAANAGATSTYEAIRASNIRRGPSVEAERVATVAAGTPLEVLGRAEGRDWYEVETAEGVRGFIYGQLIRRTPLPAPYVAPAPSVESAAPPARPVAPAPPVETAAAPVVRPGDGKLVRVFYGTDRVNAGTAAAPRFSGVRARQLTLGTVVVRIPPEHQLGLVERPWSFSVFGQNIVDLPEDPERHFTIYRIAVSDGERFVDDLRQVVGVSRSYQHQAFVFVHGYNVSFEAAAFRTAQIAHDLSFDGAPIFYSWPSRGDLTDYEYDQNSASQARPFLKEFLELVRRRSGADVVHLIAHSMGTGPLLEVLAELKNADAATPLFNEIVLAAPDIDVDVFYYLAKRVQGVAKGVTMYVSSADRAMQAAREYARGVARAGDVPQTGPVIEFGIDTIDATAISTGFFGLNHSDYAENRILLNDIGLLLRAGLRPPSARNLTLVRVPVRDGYYWKYPD